MKIIFVYGFLLLLLIVEYLYIFRMWVLDMSISNIGFFGLKIWYLVCLGFIWEL